jgi:hypothetical protein
MSDICDQALNEGHDEVRSGASEINWLLITDNEGSKNTQWLFHSNALTGGQVKFKRANFVFIKYLAKGFKMNHKALINVHRRDV